MFTIQSLDDLVKSFAEHTKTLPADLQPVAADLNIDQIKKDVASLKKIFSDAKKDLTDEQINAIANKLFEINVVRAYENTVNTINNTPYPINRNGKFSIVYAAYSEWVKTNLDTTLPHLEIGDYSTIKTDPTTQKKTFNQKQLRIFPILLPEFQNNTFHITVFRGWEWTLDTGRKESENGEHYMHVLDVVQQVLRKIKQIETDTTKLTAAKPAASAIASDEKTTAPSNPDFPKAFAKFLEDYRAILAKESQTKPFSTQTDQQLNFLRMYKAQTNIQLYDVKNAIVNPILKCFFAFYNARVIYWQENHSDDDFLKNQMDEFMAGFQKHFKLFPLATFFTALEEFITPYLDHFKKGSNPTLQDVAMFADENYKKLIDAKHFNELTKFGVRFDKMPAFPSNPATGAGKSGHPSAPGAHFGHGSPVTTSVSNSDQADDTENNTDSRNKRGDFRNLFRFS